MLYCYVCVCVCVSACVCVNKARLDAAVVCIYYNIVYYPAGLPSGPWVEVCSAEGRVGLG